jgi:thermolysin
MRNIDDIQREKISSLKKRDPHMQVRWEPDRRTVAYARGHLSEQFNMDRLEENPFKIARDFLQENKELFGNLNMTEELVEDRKIEDDLGMTHVSFQQRHQDVPVFGGSIRVHFDQEGRVSSISSKLMPDMDISVDAKISASDAEKVALEHAGEGAVPFEERAPKLIIFPHNGKNYLCWRVELNAHAQKKPAEWVYFIDAAEGKIVFHYNNLHDAGPTTGSGTGYYSGIGPVESYEPGTGVYQLRDTTRAPYGGPEILTNDYDGASPSEDNDNNWDDPTTTPRDQNQGAEVDVHRYAADTIDYFLFVHNRNSFDDAGYNLKIDVHYGENLNNAYWSTGSKRIMIGDGNGIEFDYLGTDDVVAHEFTHGVTQHSCNALYYGESGAINEAFSDSFAAFITGNWFIGEDAWLKDELGQTTAPALRNLQNPTNSGQYNPADPLTSCAAGHCPDHYDDRYTGTADNGGVHINPTIIAHAIYLMTQGGDHWTSGVHVTGIGQAAVEAMLYNVQTIQLMSNQTPTFLEFREAMINACLDLYPEDLENLASVKAAFKAVGIGPDLYVRDTTADTGAEPYPAGACCWSPDIIVRKELPADPQTEFADPTCNTLSENVEYGQDNFVFVRISNGGNHPADADVDIYFCPITTFPNPNQWQYLGTITEFNIAPGEFRISEHLVFKSDDIPAPDHYCFVAVVQNPLDPAPDHTLISTISEFYNFIQYSNNYAWKNVFVEDEISLGEPVTMEFDIGGMARAYTRAELEIDLRYLPEGTEFEIKLPKIVFRGLDFVETGPFLPRRHGMVYTREEELGLQPFRLRRQTLVGRGHAYFRISPRRIAKLKRLLLKPGKKVRAIATVRLPENVKGDQFIFSVKQVVDKVPVGQVNCVLRPKKE